MKAFFIIFSIFYILFSSKFYVIYLTILFFRYSVNLKSMFYIINCNL
nr:MAG TPA: hypothetical protein [Caudoviricetes sp.]